MLQVTLAVFMQQELVHGCCCSEGLAQQTHFQMLVFDFSSIMLFRIDLELLRLHRRLLSVLDVVLFLKCLALKAL